MHQFWGKRSATVIHTQQGLHKCLLNSQQRGKNETTDIYTQENFGTKKQMSCLRDGAQTANPVCSTSPADLETTQAVQVLSLLLCMSPSYTLNTSTSEEPASLAIHSQLFHDIYFFYYPLKVYYNASSSGISCLRTKRLLCFDSLLSISLL